MAITKDTTITLEVTIEEANNILAGLQELSAKICNPLSQKIQIQAKKQLPQEEVPQK